MSNKSFSEHLFIGAITISIFVLIIALIDIIESPTQTVMYPQVFTVVDLIEEEDLVVLQDSNQHIWLYEGIEDWMIDDIAGAIINDNGTESIYDDIIVQLRYCGTF